MNSERLLLLFLLGVLSSVFLVHAALLNPASTSNACSGSLNYSDCYEQEKNQQAMGANITKYVVNSNGTQAVHPWYSTSTGCAVTDLQSGSNCNIGTVDANQFCIVSDEQSVACLNVAKGMNQTQMDWEYNTINHMAGSYGQLPGWKAVVNLTSNSIDAKRANVNANGDSASDATARFIECLFTAANNTFFTNQTAKNQYYALAVNLSRDSYTYESDHSKCYNSTLGDGQICILFGGGANVVTGGIASGDYFYSAYAPYIAKAMLLACQETGNQTYCQASGNVTLQYLQSSNYTGTSFRVPPGKSFKYGTTTVGGQANVLFASCTNTCTPDQFDSVDAPRAFSWGETQYVASNYTSFVLPNMSAYLGFWNTQYLSLSSTSVPIQYYANGTNSAATQSGYFAQGLQSQAMMGSNMSGFETTLRSANSHYNSNGFSKTPDNTACFGIYTEAPWMSAMSTAMDRQSPAFSPAPTTNNTMMIAKINSTTSTITSPLQLYCAATNTQNNPVTFNYITYLNNVTNQTGTTDSYCYQETANVSTSCGGLSTGSYNTVGTWSPSYPTSNLYDGNYSTQSVGTPSGAYLIINYTKPVNATGALWQFKAETGQGTTSTTNYTIPTSCFNQNTGYVLLNISDTSGGGVPGYGLFCDNGTWNTILAVTNDPAKTQVYEEAIFWQMNNATINVGSIPNTSLQKGQQWILSCQANDTYGVTTYQNSTIFTVLNSAPNASNVLVADLAGSVNCTYTFTDIDAGDVNNGSTYRWFRNNTLLSNTKQTMLQTGNYSNTDQLICEVTPTDGFTSGIPVNSSVFVSGDTTPPRINTISQPSTGTISDVLSITINCTDANPLANGYPLVQWTNPNAITEGNFTMTNVGGNLYQKNYTFSIVGTYTNFVYYCADGSNNINTTAGPTNLVITTGQVVGGGGGSSSTTTIVDTGKYAFESNLLDGGYSFLTDYFEGPKTLSYQVTMNKLTYSCTAVEPLHCTVSQDGTSVTITSTVNDYEHFYTTIDGVVSATSKNSEVATTAVKFRVVNLVYGIGPTTTISAGTFLTGFPYLVRVNHEGNIDGARLLTLLLLGTLLGIIMLFDIKNGR